MNEEEIRYDAFISYRHAELDTEIAKGIQRRLESFVLPANLRSRYPKDHRRIRRIFRDEDELPLAESLSDQIEKALRNSEWLIVICSPRYQESFWCAKEIEYFRGLRGLERILCVLIEGEPDVSFPEGVCYREVTDADGSVRRERVEPLAADVRGDTPAERRKKMDDAVLRIAAPMFGLSYDDLKQRHREQKARRIVAVSGIAAAVCFLFAVTATGFSLRINRQNKQISEQNKQIEQQNKELQEQYDEQMVRYAESMAVVSEQLMKSGDGKAAMYAALSAMPRSLEDESFPYLASTQYALSNALGIYEHDEFLPWDTAPVPEDENFWDDAGRYRDLKDYLAGQNILCGIPWEDGSVLLPTVEGNIFLYKEEENVLQEATASYLPGKIDDIVEAAAWRDGVLWIKPVHSSMVSCYRWKGYDGLEPAGSSTREQYRELIDISSTLNHEDVISDDGLYRAGLNDSRNITISDRTGLVPLRVYYDIHAEVRALRKLKGTDMSILILSGKYSYLLDKDLNILARVAYYYDYDSSKKSMILYHMIMDSNDLDLYYCPLRSYDEIVGMAEKELEGYTPSEEVQERYQMMR
ncbi:MAG: toll/interleukin-1 receptor domain-containing protein [Lachnospiraceae bacterium]|nr:toll/interleukin-1 receptor domain-containing protein [Lachnospiraceae bacterium]